jgi:hypothetical protein
LGFALKMRSAPKAITAGADSPEKQSSSKDHSADLLTVGRVSAQTAAMADRGGMDAGIAAPVRDPQIRRALIAYLKEKEPDAVIFEELPLLRGAGRADVVSVNGSLDGFEIKSERDSLARLVTQTRNYGSAFEYTTVVVAPKHLKSVRAKIPRGWGIMTAESNAGRVSIVPKRPAWRNHDIDRQALIRLMWRRECVWALRNHGVKAGRNALVIDLWAKLMKLPTKTICREVRNALKARRGSESAGQRKPCGDLLPS